MIDKELGCGVIFNWMVSEGRLGKVTFEQRVSISVSLPCGCFWKELSSQSEVPGQPRPVELSVMVGTPHLCTVQLLATWGWWVWNWAIQSFSAVMPGMLRAGTLKKAVGESQSRRAQKGKASHGEGPYQSSQGLCSYSE